ncbi:glycosyltransferase family 2 protein [Mucilaginibacter antarcticus]|uniref:Glycosyltransferase family 2 protein n=1 Tax=Mucilaginibacter antarcticus TaxID=1855725 RepID=A0ABW5XNT5_9SPHI
MDISVVIPLYNEVESLPELTSWIAKVMQENNFLYEILLIDDGSTDGSWEKIMELRLTNPFIRGIKFRRNYGKSAALNTGFEAAQGKVIITMDADLQDSPDEIPELYRMIVEDDRDLVSGWKKKRHDPLSKTLPTKLYNGVTGYISGVKLNDMNCGLKAYKQKVVKNIEVYGEMHRYIPVIAAWAGFRKIGEKVVQHQPRKFGVTKFGGIQRFIRGPLDLISIMFVSKFGKRPMHLFGGMGVLSFLAGTVCAFWIIGEKLYAIAHNEHYRDVTANPLFYFALTAIIIGSQMFLTGFVAEMVSRSAPERNHYQIEDRF